MRNKTLTLTPETVGIIVESLEMNLDLREGAYLDGHGLDEDQIEQEERFFRTIKKLLKRLDPDNYNYRV